MERKLREWTCEYGRDAEVRQKLEESRHFRAQEDIFRTFDAGFRELNSAVQAYVRELEPSKDDLTYPLVFEDSSGICKLYELPSDDHERGELWGMIREIEGRWATASVELRCIDSLLEKVLLFWEKFMSLANSLEKWLHDGSVILHASEDEKLAFFQVKYFFLALCVHINTCRWDSVEELTKTPLPDAF